MKVNVTRKEARDHGARLTSTQYTIKDMKNLYLSNIQRFSLNPFAMWKNLCFKKYFHKMKTYMSRRFSKNYGFNGSVNELFMKLLFSPHKHIFMSSDDKSFHCSNPFHIDY